MGRSCPWFAWAAIAKEKLEASKRRYAEAVKDSFTSCSALIFRYSYWSIGLTLLVSALLGTGLIPGYARVVDGADKLYSLQKSTARTHGLLHSVLFPESRVRQSYILVSVLNDTSVNNVLAWEFLRAVSQIDSLVRGKILDPTTGVRVAIPSKKEHPTVPSAPLTLLTYDDLCLKRPDGQCVSSGILETLTAELSTTPTSGTVPPLLMGDGFIIDLKTRRFLPAHALLGGIKSQPCVRPVPTSVFHELTTGRTIPPTLVDIATLRPDVARFQMTFQCIHRASAMLLIYSLHDTPEQRGLNEQWELTLTKVLKHIRRWGPVRISYNAFRSRDDELRASTSECGDVVYVILTFLSTVAYCAAVNFSCDLYQAKAVIATTGALAAILGLVAGMGLCCHLGLSLVPTAFVCPFLVLGIGVDDTFVILNSYSLTAALVNHPEERCRVCLRDCGIALTLTTITSLISFTVGSWSAYLSIRNFCLFCGASLLFGYAFCFTFFFASLCLDAKREAERHLCCFGYAGKSPASRSYSQTDSYDAVDDMFVFTAVRHLRELYAQGKEESRGMKSSTRGIRSVFDPPGNVGRRWRYFLLRYYGPFLMHPFTKALVVAGFLLLIAVSSVGFARLDSGLDLRDLAPSRSHLRAFDADIERYFGVYDAPTDIGFMDASTAWWSPQFVAALQRFDQELVKRRLALKVIDPLLLISGDVAYATWIHSGNGETFEKAVLTAVSSPDTPYHDFQYQFVWEGKRLRAWKLTILPPFMRTSRERALWMLQLRRLCNRFGTLYVPTVATGAGNQQKNASLKQRARQKQRAVSRRRIVPWNYMMVYYESDLRIPFSVVTELTTAGVTLGIVALLGLPDMTSGSIVTSVMAMIDLGVFGFMYFWGVKLNMVSMVNLLISIGFAVDYSTHVCHTFLECQGPTRDARAVEALALMGNPVLHGAVASLIGVIMLGFSESLIFRIFFKMMTLIVVFGMAYGVIFLPVVLSIIGPDSSPKHEANTRHGRRRILGEQEDHDDGMSEGSLQGSTQAGSYLEMSQRRSSYPLAWTASDPDLRSTYPRDAASSSDSSGTDSDTDDRRRSSALQQRLPPLPQLIPGRCLESRLSRAEDWRMRRMMRAHTEGGGDRIELIGLPAKHSYDTRENTRGL